MASGEPFMIVAAHRDPLRHTLLRARTAFLCVGLFGFFINLGMLTTSLYMLNVYDHVIPSRSVPTLLALSAVAVGILLAGAALDGLRSRVLVRIGTRMDAELGRLVLQAMMARRIEAGAGSSAQALPDLDALRTFLTGQGLLALLDAPWAPLFLGLVFLLHPLLGLVALGGAVLLFGVAAANEFVTRRPLERASLETMAANGIVEAGLRNAEAVRAMGMLVGLSERWSERHEKSLLLQAEASDSSGALTATAKFLRQVLQAAMLGVGAWLAVHQIITPGVMVAGSIIMGRGLAPVEGAIGSWRGFVAARGAWARLRPLLATFASQSAPMPLPTPRGALRFENVAAVPPGGAAPVLSTVSFRLDPGEALGVIGPSAAGKSSLARLAVGVWRPSAGAVRLDGAELRHWSPETLGRHIGYLPQDVELFDGTVAENIARFGPEDPEAVVRAAECAGVHDLILRLPQGYDTRIGEGGGVLSGGQRQRVALARALYGGPALVVLDEPNASLDTEGEEALRGAIGLLKSLRATVLVIAHRPTLLSSMDKLLVLRDGRVEMFGSRDEVLPRVTRIAPVRTAGEGARGTG